MRIIRLKANESNKIYKAIISDDLQDLSESKSNEAIGILDLDEEWSIYFDNKEIENYIDVEFVFKKNKGKKTLIPDHVIYWDEDNVITTDDYFTIL